MSYKAYLRTLDAAQLERLLTLRPELTMPSLRNMDELVERVTTRAATQAAMEHLNAWQLRVLTALAATADADGLPEALAATEDEVQHAIDGLRERVLVWGRPTRVAQQVHAVLGPYPAGLARARNPLPQAQIDQALAEIGDAERKVLDRLVWGPPTGVVHNATRRIETPKSPVERLLTAGLLRPIDDQSVVLPREVALTIRDGRLFRDEVSPNIPPWPKKALGVGSELSPDLINRAAIGSAQELTSHVLAVAEFLDEHPVAQLATGAIGKRDFRALAARIGDPELCDFVLTLASCAKLIARSGGNWVPTTQYERWAEGDSWARWQALKSAWDEMLDRRCPDELNTLDPQRRQLKAGELRSACATQLAQAEDGQPVTAKALAERLTWLHPARAEAYGLEDCARVLKEASWLGMLAFERKSVLASDCAENPGFAAFGSKILAQSDLSLVAPAPLDRETSRQLGQFAARVSHGATGVWRLTNKSVREALDAGWSAENIRGWLAEHCASEVPAIALQLIDDIARTHGKIRVAAVSCAIQVDDEDVLVTILNHPQAADLGLVKLGANVLGAAVEPEEVVDLLREIGLAPMPTSASGVHYSPAPPRAPAPLTERHKPDQNRAKLPDPKALAKRLLDNEPTTPATLRQRLEQAQREDVWVELEYVDTNGATITSTARVLMVAGEMVNVVEKAVGQKMLQLSRISSVSGL